MGLGGGDMKVIKEAELKKLSKDGHTILLNLEKQSWVKVNDTAINIIEMVNNLEVDDAINKIESNYNVPRNQAESFVNYMMKNGVLKKKNEFSHIRLLEEEKPNLPISIGYLHITNRCNLTCGYCSYNANDRVENELPLYQIKSIIRKLSQNGFGQIVFSGGEPLCRKDFKEIVQYAKKFFDDMGLVTNGTLIDYENGEFIAKNINKVQVSIDSGIEKDHDAIRGKGSFKKAVRGVKILKEFGHNEIRITPTINKKNIDNIVSIVRIAKELDVTLMPRFFLPVGRGSCNQKAYAVDYREMVDAFKRIFFECDRLQYDKYSVKSFYDSYLKPKVSCSACKDIICIDINGDLYPCSFLMDEDLKMGNVFESTTIQEIVRLSPIGQEILERSVEKIDGCKDCDICYFCGGGCIAIYHSKTGCVSGADRECHYYGLLRDLIWKSEDLSPKGLLKILASESN